MCVQGLSKAVIFLSCLFLFIQSPSLSSHGVPVFPHYFESQEMLACGVSGFSTRPISLSPLDASLLGKVGKHVR